MRKRLVFFAGVVLTIFLVIYFFIPSQITKMITEYDPYTFENVLDFDSMRSDYGIGQHNSPPDYGFANTREINIRSLYDQKRLDAWYVPNSSSHKCIILVHGRTSNRLKTMKYLELFKKKGIDTHYNFLIPDLRNSGKSDPSKTLMGYKFAEDLAAYLLFLKNEKRQDTVLLYGFSMGTMAVLTMMNRPDLKDTLNKNNVIIEKLIFDSPLSNIKETLRKNAMSMSLPEFLFNRVYANFNNLTTNYADKMRLAYLLKNNKLPTLFLMSKTDQSTFYSIFNEEIRLLDMSNIHVIEFDSVDHVKIYQNPRYKEKYTDIVSEFIMN